MGFLYVRDVSALTGTSYSAMLISKVILTGLILLLGALNFRIVRAVRNGSYSGLPLLHRFGEAEIGIGFTVILAAASLTSSPPAADVRPADRVKPAEVVERMRPVWPRMETPALRELSPAVKPAVLPQPSVSESAKLADIAWSEYNHHWAGMVVLAAGLLALMARRVRLARHWPLVFLVLAAFLFLRADAENWPLGPRGFWESFSVAEVTQHRIFVLLIIAFGLFEWAVRNGRLSAQRAGLVFPLVCAIGGALLLTHSHNLTNVKEEYLAELSHLPLAILAVAAGWSRWLELRAPEGAARWAQWIWPVCFTLIGAILLDYREG
jgi:putative copper resistance protein D